MERSCLEAQEIKIYSYGKPLSERGFSPVEMEQGKRIVPLFPCFLILLEKEREPCLKN